MHSKYILLLLIYLINTALSAQVKVGEKLLEKREYAEALAAFQLASPDPLDREMGLLGQAKVYAAPRFEGYDPLKAYNLVHTLLAERAAMTESTRERLEKKLAATDIRRVALGVESRQLRELKKEPRLMAYDSFLVDYTYLSDRRRTEVEVIRDQLAWETAKAATDYATTNALSRRYGLYQLQSANSGIADTLINRFIREKSWAEYATFVEENPLSPYVTNDEKGATDKLLAGKDIVQAMAYVRAHSKDVFGFRLYEGLADIALRAEDLTGIKDWLVTFHRSDEDHWPAVFGHYLTTLLNSGATVNDYQQTLALAEGKLSQEDLTAFAKISREKLRDKLLSTELERAEFNQLMPLLDPATEDRLLNEQLLKIYQRDLGVEKGSSAYLERYPTSVIRPEAERELEQASTDRAAAEAEKARLVAAEEEKKTAEAAEKERLAEQEESKLKAAEDRRTGRHYANQQLWRKAQLVRIEQGETPEPYRLSEAINSEYGEFKANETTDGKKMYFTRARYGVENIYVSEKDAEGNWTVADLVTDVSTDNNSESIQLVTTDGSEMLYFKSGLFYTSEKTKTGWGNPRPLPKAINGAEWQADAWVAADGKTMFFVRRTAGSPDIYVSRKSQGNEWGVASRLDNTINTPEIDRSPVLASDLKTLYFTSSGHGGEGGTDIFVSERLDDSYLKWSEPRNLGAWLNTEGEEWIVRISPDGDRFFYTSTYENNSDIFEIYLPKDVKPRAVIIIEGTVKSKAGEGIGTTIVWQDLASGEILQETKSDPADGGFIASLPGFGEGKVGYRISQDGYYSTSGFIQIDGQQKRIVLEEPVKIYTPQELREEEVSLPLENLFFATGEAELQTTSYAELDELAAFLTKEGLCVEISGHTDNVGSEAANQLLSGNRAKAVRDYLLTKGIAPECLSTQGYGDSQPIANNSNERGRARNRRVDVKFR